MGDLRTYGGRHIGQIYAEERDDPGEAEVIERVVAELREELQELFSTMKNKRHADIYVQVFYTTHEDTGLAPSIVYGSSDPNLAAYQ
tara:strand:- start:316 stop:576 length:261 start_codon:yes stop_codon:yes gene_type:complete